MDPQTQAYVNALSGPNPKAGPSYWPDQSDLAMSKKYDTLYGSPWAPDATAGNSAVYRAPLDNIVDWRQNQEPIPAGVTKATNSEADADRLRAQTIASERSAMAKLGFNPNMTASSPTSKERWGPLNGLYKPGSNVSWYDEALPNAAMHESMHRAFQMLAKDGKLPKGVNRSEEELLVRALMNRAYGDVEVQQELDRGARPDPARSGFQQVLEGKKRTNDPIIDELEAAAAAEVARRHPRGPR